MKMPNVDDAHFGLRVVQSKHTRFGRCIESFRKRSFVSDSSTRHFGSAIVNARHCGCSNGERFEGGEGERERGEAEVRRGFQRPVWKNVTDAHNELTLAE